MKKSIISLAIASLAVLAGCSDFGNLNQDPTKSTDMDPNILLPNLQDPIKHIGFKLYFCAKVNKK